MIIVFEIAAMIITVVLAARLRDRPKAQVFRALHQGLRHLAQRRALTVVLVGLLSFAMNAGIGLWKPILPRVHDEFSYLLAADTFYHGRLTNPTHPLWEHFETFHVIQQPTYQSKYPPAFGVMLALGRCFGSPEIGLWLCYALACASVTWMLQGWLRPYWALLGGLLMATHSSTVVWWGQTYWGGGGLSVVGGALVYGALRRIVARPNVRDSCLFGLGLFVLAHTRPFEGLVVALPAMATLLGWLCWQRSHPWRQIVGQVVLPNLGCAAIILGSIAGYNHCVTGNAFRFPYQVHEETYASTPLFLWQTARPAPDFRHAIIRDFQMNWSRASYHGDAGWGFFVQSSLIKLYTLWKVLLRPAWSVTLVTLPWVLRDRWMKLAVIALGFELTGILCETFVSPHYFAPAMALLILVLIRSIEHLRTAKRAGSRFGRILFRGIVLTSLLSLWLGVMGHVATPPDKLSPTYAKAKERDDIIRKLTAEGGKHLVLVEYSPKHTFTQDADFFEWVYNDANIDHAKIVWARPMDAKKTKELLDYFADRKVWVLSADSQPAKLRLGGTP